MVPVHSAISGDKVKPAVRGWLLMQRARIAKKRHRELGEVSAQYFYATRLRFQDLAFDIGANHGEHTEQMLCRGARVLAVEPQASLADELNRRFDKATVLCVAVSDTPGEAVLHLAPDDDRVASLDASFADRCEVVPVTWSDHQSVPVTTLDALIDEYGDPTVIKIDTEGTDHRVLQGLSRPVKHILFEVHAALPDAAAEAFARLDQLGNYRYAVKPSNSWVFRGPEPYTRILDDLPVLGDVYAQRIR